MTIDPEYKKHLPTLRSLAGLKALKMFRAPTIDVLQQQRAAAVRRLAERLILADKQARELAEQIKEIVKTKFSPLTALCGVDLLTAGALAGILGPGRRFD